MAGMAGGFLAHLGLYAAGIWVNGSFYVPLRVLNMDPILWGLLVSFLATYLGGKLSREPDAELVRRYFH